MPEMDNVTFYAAFLVFCLTLTGLVALGKNQNSVVEKIVDKLGSDDFTS